MNNPFSRYKKLGISFWLCLFWIILVMMLAVFADVLPLPGFDVMDWDHTAAPPGTSGSIKPIEASGSDQMKIVYFLGTDSMGRDILTRLIYGARVSLAVGLITPLIGLCIGGILGIIAGFYKGRIEIIIMALMDTILAFPGLVLLLAMTFLLGPELKNIIMTLGFLTIPSFARIARANTLSYSQRDYIQAARMIGQNDLSIIIWEIIPNIITPMVIYSLLVVSYMIMAEGALSFLGLSVPSPTPSWGGMIAQGREVLEESVHVSLFPACIMFLTVLSFNLLGDSLRNLTDDMERQL